MTSKLRAPFLALQEAQARDMEAKLRSENEALAAELRGLDAFTRAKTDLEASQLRMRAENDALQAKLERADAEAERKYVCGTMGLKREYDQKVEELKKRCAPNGTMRRASILPCGAQIDLPVVQSKG